MLRAGVAQEYQIRYIFYRIYYGFCTPAKGHKPPVTLDIGDPDIGDPDIGDPDIGDPDIDGTCYLRVDVGNLVV